MYELLSSDSLDAVPSSPMSTNGNHAPTWELNGSEPHYLSDEVPPPEPRATRSSGGFFGTALFKAIVAGGVVLVSKTMKM